MKMSPLSDSHLCLGFGFGIVDFDSFHLCLDFGLGIFDFDFLANVTLLIFVILLFVGPLGCPFMHTFGI